MRIFAVIAAAMLTACLLAAPAAAQSVEEQPATNRSGLRDIPKDRRAEAQEMLYAYKDDIQALTEQIQDIMGQMDTQFEAAPLNESRIRALANEIMGLRSTLYKKTVEFRIDFYKEFGVLPF